MPLTRQYFNVLLDRPDAGSPTKLDEAHPAVVTVADDTVEYRVEIRGTDQLRAELEGKSIGVTLKDAMHQTYLWAWASMVRQDLFKGAFMEFRKVAIKVEGEDDDDDGEPVDPTQPGATDDSP